MSKDVLIYFETVSATNIILSNNPYYITYSATASFYDYITIDLYLWEGSFSATPSNPNFTFTAYKRKSSDEITYINISEYLKDNIEPRIYDTWSYGYFYNEWDGFNFREFINVSWEIRSYKIISGLGVKFETENSGHKLACLGFKQFEHGANPYYNIDEFSIDNTLKRHNSSLAVYDVYLNTYASSTENLVIRSSPNYFIEVCSGKFTPIEIIFLNRYGIFDAFVFPKSSKRNVKFKSESYNRMSSTPYDYATNISPIVTYGKSGVVEWELNTDFLDDNNLKYIEDIMSSSIWYMYRDDKIIPVILIDSDFEEKKSVNVKVKSNYTLKFKEAGDYIQNIR